LLNSNKDDPQLLSTTELTSTNEDKLTKIPLITNTNVISLTTALTSTSTTTTIKEQIKCRIKIEHTDYVVNENEILYLDCPKESNIIGSNVYKCISSGEFTLINSTCIQKSMTVTSEDKHGNWLEKLEDDVKNTNKNIIFFKKLFFGY
jgi:hypothetical protein